MGTVIAIVVAVIVVIVIVGIIMSVNRRRETKSLQERFGPEYDRTVETVGDKGDAGTVLKERVKRVESLNIVDLSYQDRENFTAQWKDVQAEFVDDPAKAIGDADNLVQAVMAKRGYPVGDFEQRAEDISVDHPGVVENYRSAHSIAEQQENGEASTEDLRQAMVHYRGLFEDLLQPETADMAAESSR
jgi:hypothetical protein